VIRDDEQVDPSEFVGRRPASTPRRRASDVLVRGGGEDPRVLIVEPDLFFAEFVGAILRDARPGFVVREVPSLSRALDHLFEAKGAEMIITNLDVAEDTGPMVPARLRHAAPEAAIIVLSATTDPDVAGECLRRGADVVLSKKRLTVDSFLAAIRDYVDRPL
jgi:DNA-binding NarL/FixJ family response regulator